MLHSPAHDHIADRAYYDGEDPSLVHLLPDDLTLPYTIATTPDPDLPWVDSGIDFARMAEEHGPWETRGSEPDTCRAVLYWNDPAESVYALVTYTEGDVRTHLFPTAAFRTKAARDRARDLYGGE